MSTFLRHILLVTLMTLCLATPAAAQSVTAQSADSYDSALDKYESICDRCIELRSRINAGEAVDMSALSTLLSELSSLRATLSGASGNMSAAQAERFYSIRERYISGMQKSGRRALTPLPRLRPALRPILTSSSWPGSLSGFRPAAGTQAVKRHSVEIGLLTDMGFFPTPSYGAMAVLTVKRMGVYAHYRSNFLSSGSDYGCSSDGVTDYGYIWATGKSRTSRSSASAGLAIFPTRRLGFYAGAGVMSYTLCWEDIAGAWAKVTDNSYRNLAADGGIFLTFSRFLASMGVSSDFRGHSDLMLGVGVRF